MGRRPLSQVQQIKIMEIANQVRDKTGSTKTAWSVAKKRLSKEELPSETTFRKYLRQLEPGGDPVLPDKEIEPWDQEWSEDESDMMFLANMFGQGGSDQYMRDIGGGDVDAMKGAYSKYHHTSPDEATLGRMEQYF